jgi:hypothetical protein
MPYDTTAKVTVSDDIRRRGGLGEYVSSIELTVNLVKLEMTRLTSLMHRDEMHAKVNMLCKVTATDGTLRPSDARFIVGKYRSRCSLRKAKVG